MSTEFECEFLFSFSNLLPGNCNQNKIYTKTLQLDLA